MKPPAQTRIEVPLNNGTVWQGTEAQLRRDHPDWLPYAIVVQATTIDVDEIEDKYFNTRLPSSARNYALLGQQGYTVEEHDQVIARHAVPPRRSAQAPRTTEDVPHRKQNPNKNNAKPPDVIVAQPARQSDTRKRRGGWHPLWYLGVGMCVMFTLWVGIGWFWNWWNTT